MVYRSIIVEFLYMAVMAVLFSKASNQPFRAIRHPPCTTVFDPTSNSCWYSLGLKMRRTTIIIASRPPRAISTLSDETDILADEERLERTDEQFGRKNNKANQEGRIHDQSISRAESQRLQIATPPTSMQKESVIYFILLPSCFHLPISSRENGASRIQFRVYY